MYGHIMLPLDGSPLAEQALPHAVALARTCAAGLDFVAVVPLPDPEAAGAPEAQPDWGSEAAQQKAYLNGLVAQAGADGLRASSQLLRGDVAETILRHVEEAGVDLIVMCTHGRSGLGRWVYGSIADRVLRHAPVPVLLVRAQEA
jgi:nucleotide-binding universal stress UspA family protein